MSSVQGNEDCPRCGQGGVFDYNCRTSEKWFQCLYCGFTRTVKTLIDRKKSTEEKKFYKLNKKGYLIQRCFIKKALGAFYIEGGSRPGQFGALMKDPLDEEFISSFKKALANPDVDATQSYLTRWDDKKKEVVFLIGTPEMALRFYGGGESSVADEDDERPDSSKEDELPF